MKSIRAIQWSFVAGLLLLQLSIHASPANSDPVFAVDAGAGAGANPAITNAAAIIDGHVITREEVTLKCLREYREAILQRMIPDYVLDRECQRRGIKVADADIDTRIAKLRKSLAPQSLEDKLNENHMSMADVRDSLRREIEKPLLVADKIKTLHAVHCMELVVKVDSSRSESNALTLATAYRHQIISGADFAAMAIQHSDGAIMESNGDMGVLYDRILRPVEAPVLETALTLKEGEISQPIKATDGYHIVKVVSMSEHHPASENALYAEAEATSRRQQIGTLVPDTVTALIKKSHITFSEDSDFVPGKPLPEAAAIIDGHAIPTQVVLEKCMATYGPKVTDVLVQDYLVNRECEKRAIKVKESEIDERVEALRKQCAPMTLDQGIKMHHTTMDGLRDDFRQDMERTQLAMGEIKFPRMVHARIILIKSAPTSPSDVDRANRDSLTQIIAIQDQLKAGKRFEDLAAQYCVPDDPSKCGDMGIIYPYKNGIDTDLGKAAGAMKPGEISSEPIKTWQGYALLQIISDSENHPESENATYAKAQDRYRAMEAQQQIRDIIIGLIKKSNVVYYVHA